MAESILNSEEKNNFVRSPENVEEQLQRIRKNNDQLTELANELEQISKSRKAVK